MEGTQPCFLFSVLHSKLFLLQHFSKASLFYPSTLMLTQPLDTPAQLPNPQTCIYFTLPGLAFYHFSKLSQFAVGSDTQKLVQGKKWGKETFPFQKRAITFNCNISGKFQQEHSQTITYTLSKKQCLRLSKQL